jgi:cytidylate kinase
MGKDYIVTIDGPVGTGKSTIGRLLARKKRLTYLDTGAMYRVVALEAQKKGVDSGDEKLLQELCSHVEIFFKQEGDGQRVFSYGRDVTDEIRTPEISMLASRVSAVKTVREALVKLQREIGKKGGIVVEGRDAGTVIFPNARFKFYLDATLEVRAKRRYKELVEKNIKVDYIDILQDIEKRDSDDSSRDISPLKPAAAAAVIDTTEMTIEDVLSRVSEEIELRSSSLP